MKHYKAIFFDWDGTAVLSRKAPVEDAVNAMRPLLDKGVKLCIVSGTTYENIAGGKLHSYFTPKQLENLYLGLGRGAFDYGYNTAGASRRFLWIVYQMLKASLLYTMPATASTANCWRSTA